METPDLQNLNLYEESYCMDQAIRVFALNLNDYMSDGERRKLKPLIQRMIGTRAKNIATIRKRAFIAANFAVLVATPLALEAAGLLEEAARLRVLPPIIDCVSAEIAREAAWDFHSAVGVACYAASSAYYAAEAARNAAEAAHDAAEAARHALEAACDAAAVAVAVRYAAGAVRNAAEATRNSACAAHHAAGKATWKKITPLALHALDAMIEASDR